MSKLAIDLTYQPVGGALAQIIEIIKNVETYSFSKVIFYTTKENLYLFDECIESKVVVKIVQFSNSAIIFRTLWAQIFLPFLRFFQHR